MKATGTSMPSAYFTFPITSRSPRTRAGWEMCIRDRYRPELLGRARLVVGAKADVATRDLAPGPDRFVLSAVTHRGLEPFLGRLADMVEEARAAMPEEAPAVVHRPAEQGYSVRRDDDGHWRVHGRGAERVVAMADLTNPEALAYVQERFRRMGVDRALRRAGVREGDPVRVGPMEFEYVEGS